MAAERRLGPYILREQVSAGAFSVTYRAEHAELGRAALIKALKPTVSSGGAFAAGLEREARILARIRHPGVVEIHDVRRDGDAIWLVLEPLHGPTLAALLARAGRLDPDAAAAIALDLARVLGHAHERGVVHRGVRPEHVVITTGGAVKIIELSTASDARGHAERLDTVPEPFEATLALARTDYMAPEQILGDPAGPPADVFALGVVLFEMLTGERPFDPHASRAPSKAGPRASQPDQDPWTESRAIAHRVRHEPPRPLRVLAPEVSRTLERVVLRCLEKEPELRYPDGHALAVALEEALAERTSLPGHAHIVRALAAAKLGGDEPPAAAPGPLPGPAPAPRAGHPLTADVQRLAAIFALIVAGGLIVELGIRDRDAPEPSGAEATGMAAGQRGALRVLARPWAEVIVDGESIDVTPMARPIPVAPGRHYVTFQHPNAPDEKREVVVAAGQTVVLDVSMRIDRGAPDAGAGRGVDAGESP